MLSKIYNSAMNISLETLDQIADRLGLSSIISTVGITVVKEVTETSWVLADYALLISAIGGVLFCIEKLFVIYHRCREAKVEAKKDKQKKKSRKLP
tara:strand:- start:27518 stop:27805 length:288 start_codon:yes stop_codon:yes gene_type:complete